MMQNELPAAAVAADDAAPPVAPHIVFEGLRKHYQGARAG